MLGIARGYKIDIIATYIYQSYYIKSFGAVLVCSQWYIGA